MPVIALVSAKGSPGVTTTAAALAAAGVAAGRPTAWVELDPTGGSGWVQSRASHPGTEPTLGELARSIRDGTVGADWARFTVPVPPGVPGVLAPPGRPAASTIIAEGTTSWCEVLGQGEAVVAVDTGRWSGDAKDAIRLAGADVVGLICRSTLESTEHAWHLVGPLRDAARCPVALVVVGTKPYHGLDVASALGLPLAGVMEWRRRDVAALWATGGARTILVRNAARVLDGLLAAMPGADGRLALAPAVPAEAGPPR